MTTPLEKAIVRILAPNGETVGAGFVVTEDGHFESHPVSVSLMRRMEARDITLSSSLVVATGEEQETG